jgi:precorrin-6B methylase 2
MLRRWVAGVLAIVALAGLTLAHAQSDPAAYQPSIPSPDGIGKRYMGREIARVMGWQGASWLERDEREREERTDLLVAALGLKPGMQVADVGAGTGYFTWRMAAAVAPGGKVFAADVQPEMIALLRRAMDARAVTNVVPVLTSAKDSGLAAGSLDLALLVDVYHELEYPFEVVASLVRALKPGGRLVLVEYRAEDANVPIKPVHKMNVAQVRREMTPHALEWERGIEVLPWQHVLVFRKRG